MQDVAVLLPHTLKSSSESIFLFGSFARNSLKSLGVLIAGPCIRYCCEDPQCNLSWASLKIPLRERARLAPLRSYTASQFIMKLSGYLTHYICNTPLLAFLLYRASIQINKSYNFTYLLFRQLGDNWSVRPEMIDGIEPFICLMYGAISIFNGTSTPKGLYSAKRSIS